ncbi:MAG: ABC transporter ATP-binding protein [Rhodothermales bacterium]
MRSEPAVVLDRVSKRFGDTTAVDDISLEIRPGEFFSLLGPSGCGKTTLLRIIGGFEHPDSGRVVIQGRDVTGMTPQKRPTAMVFQNYALFPNMTVGENVAYGLRVRRVPKSERERRVEEALQRVDLATTSARPVTQLSGGQQQRVALARAVVVEPAVLLFDEPLSNLDVALREQTRRELKILQQRLGTTSLYVTHDQQEALALSDRIGVMRAGKLVQVGSPEILYRDPETAYVAEFLGGSNIIRDPGLCSVLAGEDRRRGHVLAVRPEHLRPSEEGGVEARTVSRQFLGTVSEWWLDANGVTFRAWLDPSVMPADSLRIKALTTRWVVDDLNESDR